MDDRSKETSHIDFLDGWRGMSILLVLIGHFSLIPTIHGHNVQTDSLGVECFFVLSGRLMSEILFVKKVRLPPFYYRRFTRIFPALIVLLSSLFLATALIPWLNVRAIDILHVLTMTTNYTDVAGPLVQLWSICVEEHAYILLSILALAQRRFSVDPISIMVTIAILCALNGVYQTYFLGKDFYHVYWRSDVRVASILTSAAIYLYLKDRKQNTNILPVAMVSVAFVLFGVSSVPEFFRFTIGTTCLALGLNMLKNVSSDVVLAVFKNPLMRQLGIWSFSIYLYQQPFHLSVGKMPTAILLIGALCLSLLSFYGVEKPARAFLNGLSFREPSKATAATETHASQI
jgi:peptidoglycan/LPS O-acetylase OafA/YrhL